MDRIPSKDTVCIYSGGMDSFTLVAMTHATGKLHSCLSFDYGQRHVKELAYARRYCQALGVDHHVIDLRSMQPHLLGSALTDRVTLPEGHSEDPSMKATIVPNRNMVMLSMAVAYAVAYRARAVRFGAHAGDRVIYPDCREEFVEAFNKAVALANDWQVVIEAPFLNVDKVGILDVGMALHLDYAQAWTCYAGREKACGKCGACRERLDAFERGGWKDPMEYEA